MSRRNSGVGDGRGSKLELKLHLSPPRAHTESPTSSCLSSELVCDETSLRYSSSPDQATTSAMMVVGCPRCLMYIMLAEDSQKCPKCKSTVLLDVLHEANINKTKKS